MSIIKGKSVLKFPEPELTIDKQTILKKLKMNNIMKNAKYKAYNANISVEEQLTKELYLEKTLTKIEIDDIKIQLRTLSRANDHLLSELLKYKERFGELNNSN